jgi:PKHD-type hydroxylase
VVGFGTAGTSASLRPAVMSGIILAKAVPADVLTEIRACLSQGRFVDGRSTAVGGAARSKHNLQMARDDLAERRAVELLVGALGNHAPFQEATWPDAMMRPQFCRYEPGMGYADHIDGALLGEAPDLIRCDIAVTVCLSDGSDYEGGELVIDTAGMAQAWKGSAGDAVIYAADTLHRVNEVTRGVRDVAVLWVQSLVRDPRQRRILFDLRAALDAMDLAPEQSPQVETIRRSYFNLIRMWID